MWRNILVFCSVLVAVNSFKIRNPVSKCIKRSAPLPLGAEVAGCTNAPPPCAFIQDETVFIPIVFRSPRYTTSMTTSIVTYQTIQRVVYALPESLGAWRNTCSHLLDATCPVRKGEIILYPLQLLVHQPTLVPGETAACEISIIGDDNQAMVCLRVEFVSAPQGSQSFAYKIQNWRNSIGIANPGALPLAARVAGCDMAPCFLAQREYAVIDIAFRAPRDTSTLTTTVVAYVTISKVTIPVPHDLAENSATCNYLLNSSCPVREGEILLYTLNLFIAPTFPVGLKTVIEVNILDDTGAAACLRVPFKVKQPRGPRSNTIH